MTTLALPLPAAFPAFSAPPLRARGPATSIASTLAFGRAEAGAASGSEAEEHAWIQAAQQGDADAFRRLVDRYRSLVVGLAFRIVRSREEAEETAQDAFVRAWRAAGLPPRGCFSTWLVSIAASGSAMVGTLKPGGRGRDLSDPLISSSPPRPRPAWRHRAATALAYSRRPRPLAAGRCIALLPGGPSRRRGRGDPEHARRNGEDLASSLARRVAPGVDAGDAPGGTKWTAAPLRPGSTAAAPPR
jgi:hypothetical protein